MANTQNSPSQSDEDRLHLANMSEPQSFGKQYTFNRSNVFSADGQVIFPDLYAPENRTSSPMAFITKDRFADAEGAATRPLARFEAVSKQAETVESVGKAPVKVEAAPERITAQEMQKRMAVEHPLPMVEPQKASNYALAERGAGFSGGF